MKLLIVVLGSLVAVASAGYSSRGGASSSYGSANGYNNGVSTGTSSQFRQDDHYGNYHFGYDEAHATGSTSRREEQQNGVRRGSYSLSDADGRMRTVNYIADDYGFRATVHTNEPGVEAKDPADVQIEKKQESSYSSYGGNGGNGAGYATGATSNYASASGNTGYAQQAPAFAQMRSASGYSQAPISTRYATVLGGPLASSGYGSAPAMLSRSYGAQSSHGSQTYAASARSYGGNSGQSYGASAQSYEAPAPRAFSYSFGTSHIAPMGGYAAAASTHYGPAPVAPVHYQQQQQNLEY